VWPHPHASPAIPAIPALPSKAAWFAPWLVLLGAAGFAAAWVLLAFTRGQVFAWVAVVAALDIALLLRMGRVRPGMPRAALGVLATVLTIVAATWGVLAALSGLPLGLLPWEAVLRLGPHHAWTLFTLAYGQLELAWFAVAIVVAAIASR
jgi:hypothetical protein